MIPIVHASGGPLYDIVVPVDGQRTGASSCLAPLPFYLFQTLVAGVNDTF